MPAAEELLKGRATPEGTRRYAERFAALPDHFRCPDKLWLSSIGLGTRSGEAGGGDDLAYRSAIGRALEVGVNVYDTALSYRMQHSERNVGAALRRAFREGAAARDEIVVISKAGYLTVEAHQVRTRSDVQRYLYDTYVATKLVDIDGLVNGQHSLDAAFLRDQIGRSRRNLGLATIDLYCIQDPELHLLAKGPDEFRRLLREAIATLESCVAGGEIAAYGFSTWSGLFTPYTDKGHLSIVELFEAVLEVGGPDHHMRGIQFPYSLGMGEALGLPSQFGSGARPAGVLDTLEGTGTAVFTCVPLLRGQVMRGLPAFLREELPGITSHPQVALQFARSTPGVTTALVGMRDSRHVDHNLELARQPPAPREAISRIFERALQP
jgi:aryl-alcohol dehydrogenase-like predicted oxidoreductase